jgi:hypothetical protein
VGYVDSRPFGFGGDGLSVGCDYELAVVALASACDRLPDVRRSWLICGGFPDGDGAASGYFDEDV